MGFRHLNGSVIFISLILIHDGICVDQICIAAVAAASIWSCCEALRCSFLTVHFRAFYYIMGLNLDLAPIFGPWEIYFPKDNHSL